MKRVFVVYTRTDSHAGGNFVHSIWTTEKKAKVERGRLALTGDEDGFYIAKWPLNVECEINEYHNWVEDCLNLGSQLEVK